MRTVPATTLAAIAALGLAAPAAPAADPAPGALVKIALASPAKGQNTPRFGGAALTVGRPATSTRSSLTLPAGTATLGPTSTARLHGSITFSARGRRATVTALRLTATARGLHLSGRVGGAAVTVFESRTGSAAAAGADELRLRRGALKLTRPGAMRLGRVLRVTLRPGTTLGVASGTLRTGRAGAPAAAGDIPAASGGATAAAPPVPPTPPPPAPPPPDTPPFGGPFGDACVTSTAFGPLTSEEPEPGALPSGAPATTGTLTWDMRPSFRDYVDAGGRIATWGGAARTADGRFTFTFDRAERAGDQVIARFRGRVDFCYPTHSFRIALADPTVVIDGGQPHVLMTGDSLQGVPPVPATLIPPRRVRLATFTAPAAAAAGTTRTWTVASTTLTTAGADIANATDSPGAGFWGENTPFGGFVLTATD